MGKRFSKRAPAGKSRRKKKITKKSQTGSYRRVWSGTAMYTKGGLTKDDLCLNRNGKVISKKRFANSKKASFQIRRWLTCVKKARKKLGITGFVLINRGPKGKALYDAAKALYNKK